MAEVRAIVLRAAGINCDMETEYALELAGAKAQRMHINRIIEDKTLLEEFQIIVFPGALAMAMTWLRVKSWQTKSYTIFPGRYRNSLMTAN